MTVYSVEDLAVHFGDRASVEGMSFSVAAGECLALVGESGSGKTQACLAPFRLTSGRPSGSATLCGQELIGLTETAIRPVRGRDAGFVFQQPLSALTPHLRIGAQLAESMRSHDPERLAAALADVGIDRPGERLRQFPHQLSGGQRQRVMIAMAVAHSPKLLIADEPTTALDAVVRRDILRLIDRLRAERGLAVILVSHDLGLVADHADKVLVMRGGRMVEQGRASQVLAAPATDYARALAEAAPRMDGPVPDLPVLGEVLLEARGVDVQFRRPGWGKGLIQAVCDASLTIRQGEAVALVGGSGSGKSTLARAVAGLGPMQGGEIRWQGRELPRRGRIAFADRRSIQLVAQDPVDSLDPRWSAARAIAEGLGPIRPPKRPNTKIDELFDEVGLQPDLGARRPAGLSGGQAQRVAIARALAADPRLLVCDEATSALDVTVQKGVVTLLARLQRERGLSLLFISHDLALVRQLCHRIVVLDQGRVVEAGLTGDVLASPRSPITRKLIGASA
jgi:peptide/nickel transport system ATP-binding protein